MIAFISKSSRFIDSPLGKRSCSVELTDDFKRIISLLAPADTAIMLYIMLSADEYGVAKCNPSDICSNTKIDYESVVASMKRLSLHRIETKKLMYIGISEGSMFQVVIPTDEQVENCRAVSKEYK